MTQTTKDAPTTKIINPNYILLDTWSTISFTRKNNHVQNIQPFYSGEELREYINGGNQSYVHTATLKCHPLNFLIEQSLVSILSFVTVVSKLRITIDTEMDSTINAHLDDGTIIISRNLEEAYTTVTRPMRPLVKSKLRTLPFSAQYRSTSHASDDNKLKEWTKQEYFKNL